MTRDTTIDEEKMGIDELRHRMKGLMRPELYKDDNIFQRFLRARNYNLDAAEAMLKNHMKWRKQWKVDEPKVWNHKPAEVIQKYVTFNHICCDKEGYPVMYSNWGNLDTKGLIKSMTRDDINHFLVRTFEFGVSKMKEQSKKMDKPIHQWVFIFDYEGFSLSQATHKQTLDFIIEYLSMYEANFPERLKAAYLVNASTVFTICWSILKPFIPKNTAKKLFICGKEDYQELLRSKIDPDQLPAFLGGNRKESNGDPKLSFINGGLVPEKYYLRGADESLPFHPEAKALVIQRVSKAEVAVEIAVAGSTLQWQYDNRGRDIEFSVLYKVGSDKRGREVVEKQKVRSGFLEVGSYKCEKPGKYALEFDNTYSWIASKEILYVVRVHSPEVKDVRLKDKAT